MSQRELVAGLDRCSYAYLSRIETGTRTPSARALEELAGRLQTTALYLATGNADGVCPFCGRNKKSGLIRLDPHRDGPVGGLVGSQPRDATFGG